MGTATFFGPPIAPRGSADDADHDAERAAAAARAVALARTPLRTQFDPAAEYEYREELDPSSADEWAVVQVSEMWGDVGRSGEITPAR